MTKRHPNSRNIGSVSTSTMRPEDLIPSFLWELQHQPLRTREHYQLGRSIESRRDKDGYYDSEESIWDLEALFDALDMYAPEGFYFGSHPGNGSDYGFWLNESFQDDFDGLQVSDMADVPKGHVGQVLHVNDHGNMTLYLYHRNHLVTVLWEVV